MLIALYFLLFSTSSLDALVIDIAKPVKQYVLVEATAKQILAINKEMLSDAADFEKDTKNTKKQLAKLNGNRLASESEFDNAFAALDQKRADARDKIVENRLKMKALMTAEEWSKVYAAEGPQK